MTPEPKFAKLDVGVLEEIEGILCLDCVPPAGVVLPLLDREDAQKSMRWPPVPPDDSLEDEVRTALDGEWLHLHEIAAFQRLRGWNRTRYGLITVRADHLSQAVFVLGCLLMGAFSPECDTTIGELEDPGNEDLLAAAKAQMAKDGTCGECNWCRLRAVEQRCNEALDATGIERGIEYRIYHLGQSVAQANREVYGYCIWCSTGGDQCADPDHLASAGQTPGAAA